MLPLRAQDTAPATVLNMGKARMTKLEVSENPGEHMGGSVKHSYSGNTVYVTHQMRCQSSYTGVCPQKMIYKSESYCKTYFLCQHCINCFFLVSKH